jgi:hypothetical protein
MSKLLPLKKVPLVNGDGGNLAVCPKSFGGGIHYLGRRLGESETRDSRAEEVRRTKKLECEGWIIEQSKCTTCKGSGMIASEIENVW